MFLEIPWPLKYSSVQFLTACWCHSREKLHLPVSFKPAQGTFAAKPSGRATERSQLANVATLHLPESGIRLVSSCPQSPFSPFGKPCRSATCRTPQKQINHFCLRWTEKASLMNGLGRSWKYSETEKGIGLTVWEITGQPEEESGRGKSIWRTGSLSGLGCSFYRDTQKSEGWVRSWRMANGNLRKSSVFSVTSYWRFLCKNNKN